MRISLSTFFQVLGLIAQDVLAFEAKQTASTTTQTSPSEALPTNDNQTPAK